MAPECPREPEGLTTLAECRLAERLQMNSEPFPCFVEPLLLSETELDDILGPKDQQLTTESSRGSRVDVVQLRESGLVDFLPGFLYHLGHVDMSAQTKLAQEAAEKLKQESKIKGRRRSKAVSQQQSPVLPNSNVNGYDSDASILSTSTVASRLAANAGKKRKACDMENTEDADAEEEARRRRLNHRRQGSQESQARPNKLRMDITWYPTATIDRFDEEKCDIVSVENPADLALGPDPWVAFQKERRAMEKKRREEKREKRRKQAEEEAQAETWAADEQNLDELSSSESEPESVISDEDDDDDTTTKPVSPALTAATSASSGGGSRDSGRIIRLKVPSPTSRAASPTPKKSSSSSSGSGLGSRTASPGGRIIKLRDPRKSPAPPRLTLAVPATVSPAESARSAASGSGSIIRLKVPEQLRSPSPLRLDGESPSGPRPVRIKLVKKTTAEVKKWMDKLVVAV